MRKYAILLALILITPGCFGDEEEDIRFNGEIPDDGVADLKFVLEDAEGPLWSLAEQEGKVVIMAFIFTRCDNTCPVTNQNVKMVKESLTESELEKTSFVSITVDWRHDSPSVLRNYTADFGYDWPHLTGAKQYLDPVYEDYRVFPYEEGDDSEEGYTVGHPSPTYILDTDGVGRVVWTDYDFPVDLFVEDVRTVLEHY